MGRIDHDSQATQGCSDLVGGTLRHTLDGSRREGLGADSRNVQHAQALVGQSASGRRDLSEVGSTVTDHQGLSAALDVQPEPLVTTVVVVDTVILVVHCLLFQLATYFHVDGMGLKYCTIMVKLTSTVVDSVIVFLWEKE